MSWIRTRRPGDVGWALMRQAEIYTTEFGYDPVFETYVAESFPPFLRDFDPALDAMWVAEANGQRIGCIAIQHADPEQAKLRWYFVEAHARGQGVGTRLLDTALDFCREAGYATVFLWTMSDLDAAAHQYRRVGFRLAEEADAPWKPSEHQQRWVLEL